MADEVRLALDDALTVDLFAGTLELAHGMPSRRSKICGPKMSTDKTKHRYIFTYLFVVDFNI
jgi:hypothetical protein